MIIPDASRSYLYTQNENLKKSNFGDPNWNDLWPGSPGIARSAQCGCFFWDQGSIWRNSVLRIWSKSMYYAVPTSGICRSRFSVWAIFAVPGQTEKPKILRGVIRTINSKKTPWLLLLLSPQSTSATFWDLLFSFWSKNILVVSRTRTRFLKAVKERKFRAKTLGLTVLWLGHIKMKSIKINFTKFCSIESPIKLLSLGGWVVEQWL